MDLENTSDTGGGYDLGWTGGGQWFCYTVDVATAGTYTLGLRIAAPSAVAGAPHLSDAAGTDLTGAVDLPATGDWQSWASVTTQVALPAARQTLTVDQDNGGWNSSYLGISADEPTSWGRPASRCRRALRLAAPPCARPEASH
ncbi:carbohydrate-binding protein [Streptomyces sasae]|uniref:carbohydrate-binding protein n=1 Tax=Streptomyces sasae TaxID=1266772 RepID=UPI00292EF807|nr:carbohydrate-binding protein [Streptomyces sasae]